MRDKDAVTSTAYIADLAAVAASQKKNLYVLLQDLFQRFGYFQEGAKNLLLPGQDGANKIRAMMDAFRNKPPKTIGGLAVNTVADFLTGEIKDIHTGKLMGRYDLPTSNVVMFMLADGTKAIARPSGTEPKIKFYILTKEQGTDISSAQTAATAKIARITEQLETIANSL